MRQAVRRGRWIAWLAAVAVAAGALASAGGASASPMVPAAIVAEAVVDFPAGAVHWSVVTQSVEPDTDDVVYVPQGPAFLGVVSGAIALAQEDGADRRVRGPGDGEFAPAGAAVVLNAGGDPVDRAVYVLIELVSDAGANPGDSFTAGAGTFDVDLVFAVVESGQTVDVPGGATPTVLLANTGSVNVAGNGGVEVIEAGTAGMFAGAVQVTAAASDRAEFMAVVVRPHSASGPVGPDAVEDQPGVTTSTTEPPPSTTEPPPSTATPTTVAPPTTAEPVIDEPWPTMPPDDDDPGPVVCIPNDPIEPAGLIGPRSAMAEPGSLDAPARCRR